MIFGLVFFASVFRLFCLPVEQDTWCSHSICKMISASRRIFWDGFQPFLKNTWFSVSFSSLQYFDCLPIEQDTWCSHSIWKMISASRRIFWDVFQPFFKNTWFPVSFFLLQYFDCLPTKLDTWCCGKWSAHQGASFEMVSSNFWKNIVFRLQCFR